MQNPSQADSVNLSDKDSSLEALRNQFDGTPYPRIPIEKDIKERPDLFYSNSIATAFYRRDFRPVDTAGMTVLDVGCGSGFKALALAHVNPGIKVIGIDLSPKSIDLARQRADFWDLGDRLEFQVLNLDDLEELGQTFDYINCDETLYLCPNPLASLKVMGKVLKPQGILRANLHDYNQRMKFLHAQKASKLLDPDSVPNSQEAIDNCFELLEFLSPTTFAKGNWLISCAESKKDHQVERFQAIYLLQGDRGFTVADTFTLLDQADLNWVGLVAPQRWDWKKLFISDKALPERLNRTIQELSERQQLELIDWLAPKNRLIDFWCGHASPAGRSPLTEWSLEQWQTSTVALHPLLQTDDFHQALASSARSLRSFNLKEHFPTPKSVTGVNGSVLPALIPLKDGPKPFNSLVERLGKARPLNPLTREPVKKEHLVKTMKTLVQELEESGYLFVW
ncbi:MAG: class I SAM-dependent methyltransferase [Cyanophyceae cyanobacterium]